MLPHTTFNLNCDSEVAFTDVLILAQNFGQTSEAAASVPEPNSFFLMMTVAGHGNVVLNCFPLKPQVRVVNSIA